MAKKNDAPVVPADEINAGTEISTPEVIEPNVSGVPVEEAKTVQVTSIAQAVLLYITRHNEAKVEDVIKFLEKNGVKAAAATIRSQVGAARKELGLTAERVKVPVEEIKAIFDAGYQTVAEVTEQLAELKLVATDAAIKTQVGKLRKAAGFGRQSFEINFAD
jgi:LysM repeat protein